MCVAQRSQVDRCHLDDESPNSGWNRSYRCVSCNRPGCKGEILKRLALGRAAMTGLNKIWKDKDIIMTTKCRIVNALVFPVVLYGCESWTIRKPERRIIDSFELWCWRRLLRIPWTARRTSKSVIEEIKATNPLEILIKKLQLSYFGHIMRIVWKSQLCWEWVAVRQTTSTLG